LKWILGGLDVSFRPRAQGQSGHRYTLRVVFRVCQYATPRYGHQMTKANPRFLDYSTEIKLMKSNTINTHVNDIVRIQAYLQTQNPLFINQNLIIVIFSPCHNLDVGER
jgi:hypothetical protein